MRQRRNNFSSPEKGESVKTIDDVNNNNDDDDDSSDSSQSDHEDSIMMAHPDEETGSRRPRVSSGQDACVKSRRLFLAGLSSNTTKWAQSITIAVAALLTYSFHTVGATVNVQVAIMTIITLVGASPFCKTHLTTAAIGAFVGGHNIIGATRGLETAPVVSDSIWVNYMWLLVLSGAVGLVWCWFVTHPKIKLLDGYSGRLGTTTFIGMNFVMLVLWGPLRVVSWDRYYYGLFDIVHVAEEDSAPPSLASAWSWTEEIELGIGYLLSVLWLGTIAGFTRLKHHQHVQEWHRDHAGEDPMEAPTPLNNVLVPVLWTLASILAANATGYKHSAGLYNGFAVGAYVGMASLQKISSITKFATVSLMAGLWGLALTPFFVGFAGKSGFTSMIGHLTNDMIEKYFGERIQYHLQRKQRLQQRQEEEEQRIRDEEERLQHQRKEEERQQLLQEQQIREAEEKEKASKNLSEPYYPPNKPSRKKELVFSTKQQRRAQQRLRQQQKQQQKQQGHSHQNQKQVPQDMDAAPPLRHRAWVATPADGDGIWEHPQLHEVSTASAKTPKLNVV